MLWLSLAGNSCGTVGSCNWKPEMRENENRSGQRNRGICWSELNCGVAVVVEGKFRYCFFMVLDAAANQIFSRKVSGRFEIFGVVFFSIKIDIING